MTQQPRMQVAAGPATRVLAGDGVGWVGLVRHNRSMIDELVDQIEGRFAELERQMSDPE
jgi:hypothetical protein